MSKLMIEVVLSDNFKTFEWSVWKVGAFCGYELVEESDPIDIKKYVNEMDRVVSCYPKVTTRVSYNLFERGNMILAGLNQ